MKALLIGISYYNTEKGASVDVLELTKLLIGEFYHPVSWISRVTLHLPEKYGYADKDVVRMEDSGEVTPTCGNIVSGISCFPV